MSLEANTRCAGTKAFRQYLELLTRRLGVAGDVHTPPEVALREDMNVGCIFMGTDLVLHIYLDRYL